MKKHPCHSDNIVALRRIEGQVRGIQKMIEDRKYCVDILNQIHAVMGSLARVEDKILEKHLGTCVTNAVKSKSVSEKDKKLSEVIKVVRQFRKGYK